MWLALGQWGILVFSKKYSDSNKTKQDYNKISFYFMILP
jgi:hypothetical protein